MVKSDDGVTEAKGEAVARVLAKNAQKSWLAPTCAFTRAATAFSGRLICAKWEPCWREAVAKNQRWSCISVPPVVTPQRCPLPRERLRVPDKGAAPFGV